MTARRRTRREHAHEWLQLVELSGLVVSEPVLAERFPGGPETPPAAAVRRLAAAWERFQTDPSSRDRRRAWHEALLFDFLELPRDRWKAHPHLPAAAVVDLPDLDQTLRPNGVLTGPEDALLLALWEVPRDQHPDRIERTPGRWRATPQTKVERWLQGSGCPFALLSSGEILRLVHVPPGLPAAWIEFEGSFLFQEREVLRGLYTLLRAGRFTGPEATRLASLAAESQRRQTELTGELGVQVREAVERLILALDRRDREAGGALLAGITPDELYHAAVVVIMRLVFLLFAEERRLLPHGNVFFDEAYGLGRLLHRLERERQEQPETHRQARDAWPRLLALFRLVFAGCPHPDLALPAYGGELFDPGATGALRRLERPEAALTNREVYAILRRLTYGRARVGRETVAQRYSFRTLDVEHIGYLYEGLLDHRAARAGAVPVVKLRGAGEAAWPVTELERRSGDELVDWLAERGCMGGGSSKKEKIREALESPDPEDIAALAHLSPETAERVRPFASVIQPAEVVEPRRFYLTTSASRRATGTHYTPIQYTRAMVRETLDPLIFVGEHGRLEEPRRLRSPRELLALKVCDPAMGSGAFLVEVVRYLGARLVDAWWAQRERYGEGTALYLPYAEPGTDDPSRVPLPAEREEAEVLARRLVAERCIFGVDLNPLAVEMAKLSLWLVTLARDKPFSFLDHALKSGDSLLGISDLEQLRRFSLDRTGERYEVVEALLEERIEEAVRLRRDLEALPSGTPDDIAAKEALHRRAEAALEALRTLADLVVAPAIAAERPAERRRLAGRLVVEATSHLDDPARLEARARELLGGRRPFHWPIEFPEVFERENPGFDAIVGNPPYMGGKKLTGAFGKPYRDYLVENLAGRARGSADLVAYFFLRALELLREGGNFGLLATNTIAEGDTRQVGLEQILGRRGVIYAAHPDEPWPNDAAVVTSRVHVHKGQWDGRYILSGNEAPTISAFLTPREEWTPRRLEANEGISYIGSYVLGMGFTLPEELALEWIDRDPKYRDVLFPYLNGEDLNSHPLQRPSRWVINFWDWPEERAREYPLAFERVERLVKPDRQRKRPDGTFRLRKPLPQRWWHHADKRPALYHAIGRGHHFIRHPEGWDPAAGRPDRVLGLTVVSKTVGFALFTNNAIFAHRLAIFSDPRPSFFALMQSAINVAWAWQNSSRLGLALNYSPSDCFETFPFPRLDPEAAARLEALGERYHALRAEIMRDEWIGLTRLYNRFHDPTDRDPRILRLRELQVEIDRAVAAAYGWGDLDLAHDFHRVAYLPENDNLRFAVSEEARIELLRRLALLNRERYEEEVTQGLHDARKTRRKPRTSKPPKPKKQPDTAPSPTPRSDGVLPFPGVPGELALYPTPEEEAPHAEAAEPTDAAKPVDPSEPAPESSPKPALSPTARRILAWLTSHPGWHAPAEIMQALGLERPQWTTAIKELTTARL